LVSFGLLHLDFLLSGYFGCRRNFGSETVEDDFGLFEVPAGIYRREGLVDRSVLGGQKYSKAWDGRKNKKPEKYKGKENWGRWSQPREGWLAWGF
jgi:hypothetical protein